MSSTLFHKHRLDYLFILLIIAAGSLVLFFKIGEVPPAYPWSDESEIAADAVDTLKGGPQLFYPGQLAGGSLAVWLEAGWIALFGRHLLGLRLLNGLVNLISALLLYLLVRQLPLKVKRSNVRRLTALTTALLFAVSTWLLGLGRIATPNWSLVPLLTSLAFFCFWLGFNTHQRRYFVASGISMGLLFYGYIPGYFVPLVPALFLILVRLIPRTTADRRPPTADQLLPFPVTIIVAAPILIFFVLNPAATLQRPLQLADTNELTTAGSLGQGAVDMLSTFGLFPNWLLQGKFEHLAFDPLVTVLFVVGLLVTLWRWREPGYLFLLLWWAVMIAPALLSRSASLGFIFEVWRRGVGAQPVSFIFAALGVLTIGDLRMANRAGKHSRTSEISDNHSPFAIRHSLIRYSLWIAAVVAISAGLGYWLYFVRWANSAAIPALFAEAPVRMVEWMETEEQADTLFIFPIRPNVSPTTRPELFTVRYLYQGQAEVAFPVMAEETVSQTIVDLLPDQPASVKLMMSDRLSVDPKGYFEYALGQRGQIISRQSLPDYTVTTYQLHPTGPSKTQLEPADIAFGQALRLVGQDIQPVELAAGQTMGVALRWAKTGQEAVDYNTRLTLYDRQDYALVRVDKPLLSAGDYRTSRHWPPGTGSTLYYTLSVPADAPPGSYTLRVVAYNTDTGVQLPPAGGQADLSLTLATITLWPNPVAVDPATLAIARPLEAHFAGGLRLIGADSSAAPTNRPGDRLWVTLLWQATEPLSKKLGLVLALAVPAGQPMPLVEQAQPLIADYPTTTWPVGHVYRVYYPVLLPARLATADYQLALRLLDLDTAEPLGEQVLVSVSVEAREHVFEAPALANLRQVDFGQAIRLLSFEVEAVPPEQVDIKLQWQAGREMAESYKIFVHLVDATGQIISQVDTLPQQGTAPTTSWVPGEIIEDELRLAVPAEISAGVYRLVIGLYNEKTGQRLMAGPNDHVVLIESAEFE